MNVLFLLDRSTSLSVCPWRHHQSGKRCDVHSLIISSALYSCSPTRKCLPSFHAMMSSPVQVKIEVQPLDHLLPDEKREAFKQAVAFYTKAVGMSLQDVNALTGVTKTLPTIVSPLPPLGCQQYRRVSRFGFAAAKVLRLSTFYYLTATLQSTLARVLSFFLPVDLFIVTQTSLALSVPTHTLLLC